MQEMNRQFGSEPELTGELPAVLQTLCPLFASRLAPYSPGHLCLLSPGWYIAFTAFSSVAVVLADIVLNEVYRQAVHLLYYLPIAAAALATPLLGLGMAALLAFAKTAVHYSWDIPGGIHCGVAFFTYSSMVGLLYILREGLRFSGTVFYSVATRLSQFFHGCDARTAHHSVLTADLALLVAREMHLSPRLQVEVYLTGLFHDLGKVAVPDAVLFKPGELTAEDWELIKQHPAVGSRVLAGIPGLEGVAKGVLHHHEHWDGTGYPDGLKGGEIPLTARIVGATDALEAMLAYRPYRKALLLTEAVAELNRCAGTQFDPQVVAILLKQLRRPKIAARLHSATQKLSR
jgi:HD-GYP domain-containing protein (c-di-GMP phosphodiesterase class II)